MPEAQQQRQLPVQLIVFATIIILAIAIAFALSQSSPEPENVFVQPTLDLTARANLTALPNAPALSENDMLLMAELRSRTLACEDFSDARRDQVLQHITWLENPQQIPPDVAFALTMGGAINGRLVYGMAIFTSTEWRLLERPADSCLIDIGRMINGLMAAMGEVPLTIYDE